jgi:hypothetical protein
MKELRKDINYFIQITQISQKSLLIIMVFIQSVLINLCNLQICGCNML